MFNTPKLSSDEESYDEDKTNNNPPLKKEPQFKKKTPKMASRAVEATEASDVSDEDVDDHDDHDDDDDDDEHDADDESENKEIEASPHFASLPKTDMKKKNTQMAKKKKKLPVKFMVEEALIKLKERKGSSIPAIKNYILNNFDDINKDRIGFYVYKNIKKAVIDGKIKQIKMKFKLAEVEKKHKVKIITKKKTAKQSKEKATTKKAATTTTTANTQKVNQEPKKPTTKTDPPKLKGAKAADVLMKKKSKGKADEINKATKANPKKSAKKNNNDNINIDVTASTSKSKKQGSTNKKPPTFKIPTAGTTVQRTSLNSAKKQQPKKMRATRGAEKSATSKM